MEVTKFRRKKRNTTRRKLSPATSLTVFPEISSPISQPRDLCSKCPIDGLPDEILIEIFSYVSAEDLAVNVVNVCFRWEVLSQVSSVWKYKTYETSAETDLEHFYKVMDHAPKLKYLKIHNMHRFGWVEVDHLLKRFGTMIVSINLSWKDVNKLHLVVKCCANLKMLRICGKTWGMGVIPYCLNALKDASNLETLETPYVFRYPYHDFADLFRSAKFCKLVKLDMSYGSHVTCGMLDAVFRKCFHIKILNLKYCINIVDSSLKCIYTLRHLEYLNLKGCNCLTDVATRHVIKCTTLTYLNMDFCHNLTKKSIQLCQWFLKDLKIYHANCRPIQEEDLETIYDDP